jgi:hypothetical protein
MALTNWTQAPGSVPDDAIPAYQYKIKSETRGSLSVFNPSNSGWSITYLVGWNSAPAISSSASTTNVSTKNLQNFLSDVLGYSYIDNTVPSPTWINPGKMHRVLPQAHYDFPDLWAVNVAPIEGVGTAQTSSFGGICYPTAKVTVEFKPLDFALETDDDINSELDRYVTRSPSLDSQYLTVNGMMRYATGIQACATASTSAGPVGGPLVASQPGKITNAFGYDYVWHSVPALTNNIYLPPNLAAVNYCAGKVNSVPFDPGCLNAPVGTMLFLGFDPKMQLPSLGGTDAAGFTDEDGGLFYWEITLKFLYRFNGFYSTDGPGHTRPAGFPGPAGNAALNGVPCGHNFIYRTYGQNCSSPYLNLPFWDLVTAQQTPITTADVVQSGPNAGQVLAPSIYQYADLNSLFTITGRGSA